MKKNAGFLLTAFTLFVYTSLYTPILTLIAYSFNKNPFTQQWTGFTFSWYKKLFESSEIQYALFNSLTVAFYATCLSLLMGICFVIYGSKQYHFQLLSLFYTILAVPEIILAVSLLQFFAFLQVPLGLITLVGGHVLLGLAYTVPLLYVRYQEIDQRLIEAAYDLGATHTQALFTIILPLLAPAIIASGLLVFIVSLDDFIISFFCAGPSVQTLPLFIFSTIRSGSTPIVNALSTLLLLFSGMCVMIFSIVQKNGKERT